MQLCQYAKQAGCTECKYLFYSQCKRFWQIHARFLMRNILREKSDAFTYTPVKNAERHKVLYSRKKDVAKSVAMQFAIEKNAEVIPYTTNTALNLVVNAVEEINAPVSFITVTQAIGEPDKIINMLENFIDTAVHNGGKVAVFVDPSCKYKFKYPKADE